MSEVIGFAGHAGAGKTTAALVLHDLVRPHDGQYIEFSDPIVSVAEAWLEAASGTTHKVVFLESLGNVLASTYGVEPRGLLTAGLESPVLDQYMSDGERGISLKITPENKEQYRGLLEWLGKSSLEHLSPTFWADMVEYKAKTMLRDGSDLVTIGGVRSALDAQAVRNVGGTIIRLRRGQVDRILPTEKDINAWQPDFDIPNHQGIHELSASLSSIWKIISATHHFDSTLEAC